ncbi:hypothetical protein GCM10010441_20540 [Kitasatospora paracochleata]|uniref:DNA-binding SARP family transcriptional activator n=1 Tax=Kitasatospora paracochleata TaxID=58354 RepID=A0ABT1J807_9ACTN|nr:AfsR/SARP family transcriptional regulator [Kitasatospora paracochleata]MCP2313568.1 DNA-binding SARP family transcriptional activator [Kitasatospora paracochleata]
MTGTGWQFNALGPLEVRSEGRSLPLGGPRQRAVLALLLLADGRTVPVERLIEGVWDGREPASARNTLQSYVSRLRALLGGPDGAAALVGDPAGYRLDLDCGHLDIHRFEHLLAEGRALLAAGAADTARTLLGDALALWRGPALGDLRHLPHLGAEAERLDDLRLTAVETAARADLAAGRPADAADLLHPLTADHPLREGPHALLMLALDRSGRRADALDLYRRTRTRLVEELGVEPGPDLAAAHRAVLRPDPPRPARITFPAPRAPFVPLDFQVPERLDCDGYTLRPITIHDLAQDHALVTDTREELWAQFGDSWAWPPKDLTLEQDLIQLAWHQQEFTRRTSFAYAVETPADGRLLGCVYLDPATDPGHPVELTHWTRGGRDTPLDRHLATTLHHWLTTRWPWPTHTRPGRPS